MIRSISTSFINKSGFKSTFGSSRLCMSVASLISSPNIEMRSSSSSCLRCSLRILLISSSLSMDLVLQYHSFLSASIALSTSLNVSDGKIGAGGSSTATLVIVGTEMFNGDSSVLSLLEISDFARSMASSSEELVSFSFSPPVLILILYQSLALEV